MYGERPDDYGHPSPNIAIQHPDDVDWSLQPIHGQHLNQPDYRNEPLMQLRPYIDTPATFDCTMLNLHTNRAYSRGPLDPCHFVGSLCQKWPQPDSNTNNPLCVYLVFCCFFKFLTITWQFWFTQFETLDTILAVLCGSLFCCFARWKNTLKHVKMTHHSID